MLYAKINPAATRVEQNSPFGAPKTTTADYMTAIARPYTLGATRTRFEIQYGSVTLDNNGYVKNFGQVMNGEAVLTADQLSTWGTDDSIVLHLIAEAVGTTVESVVSNPPPSVPGPLGGTGTVPTPGTGTTGS